jgi:hypothetical protein
MRAKSLLFQPQSITRDEIPARAAPDEWTDMRNMRFLNGIATQVRGESEVFPGNTLGAAVATFGFMNADLYRFVYSTAAALGAWNGSGLTTITPAGYPTGIVPGGPSATLLNGICVLATGKSQPYSWAPSYAGAALPLTGWQSGWTCGGIAALRYHLIAFDMTEGAVRNEQLVRWSNSAAPGALPTEWLATTTNDAGSFALATFSGRILTARNMGEQLIIYKARSTYAMEYIGGVQVMMQRLIFSDTGALSRNCIHEVDGRHFVVAQGDIILHDGATARSLISKKLRAWLFNRLDFSKTASVFVARDMRRNEMLVAYPINGSGGACVEAIIWNWRDDKIGVRDLAKSNHAFQGLLQVASITRTWDAVTTSWDTDANQWDEGAGESEGLAMTIAAQDGKFYALDSGALIGGASFTARVEKDTFALAEGQRVNINRLRPRMQGTTGQVLNIRVGVQDDASDPISWGPVEPFIVGTTEAVDIRAAGRYASVSVESFAAQPWRIEGFEIDISAGGTR